MSSLVARVRELESRQRQLEDDLREVQPIPRVAPEVVENHLAQWRRLIRQSTTTGRAVLQRILRGRLTFTPRRNEISGEIDGYEFVGDTRFGQLFEGITVQRPKDLDPNDRAGIENITEHDTHEARLNGRLKDAYGKHVRGSGVPNGIREKVESRFSGIAA